MIAPIKSLTLCLILLATESAAAQQSNPRSAIPWLSDSLTATESTSIQLPDASSEIETISVEVIGEVARDGIGLLPPQSTGFPSDLWKGTPPNQILLLIKTSPYAGAPEVQNLLRRVLLAQTKQPSEARTSDRLLLARVDRLLEIGALNEAAALIDAAGVDTPQLFRRKFDIELLTNQADQACADLQANPTLSPSRSVQVFCLAQNEDWDAAATALTLGEELEQITEAEADLLSFFLDEALLEEMDPPPISTPLTSLEFLIRESVGLPRPVNPLPTAFLHAEISPFMPLRFRLEAAEKLTRAGVLSPSVLFAAYREEKPAASGGVWERSAAVQQMDNAATAEEIASALTRLDREINYTGLGLAAANEFLLYLSGLPPAEMPTKVHNLIGRYLLLANAPEIAENWQITEKDTSTALAIATGDFTGDDPILRIFDTTTPETYLNVANARLISQGRVGEAIMAAISLLSATPPLDIDDMTQGLALLRSVGQEETAKKIAIQTHLLPPSSVDANQLD